MPSGVRSFHLRISGYPLKLLEHRASGTVSFWEFDRESRISLWINHHLLVRIHRHDFSWVSNGKLLTDVYKDRSWMRTWILKDAHTWPVSSQSLATQDNQTDNGQHLHSQSFVSMRELSLPWLFQSPFHIYCHLSKGQWLVDGSHVCEIRTFLFLLIMECVKSRHITCHSPYSRTRFAVCTRGDNKIDPDI